jgi:hypothetical protein
MKRRQKIEDPAQLCGMDAADWPQEVALLKERLYRVIRAARYRRGLTRAECWVALIEVLVLTGGYGEEERVQAALTMTQTRWRGHPHQCPECHHRIEGCTKRSCREALMRRCAWCREGLPRPPDPPAAP